MNLELLLIFGLAIIGGGIGSFLSLWSIRRRTYSLECDVSDLQQRHLSAVRKAASRSRWDKDEALELAVETAVPEQPKKEGWTKWGSSRNSS